MESFLTIVAPIVNDAMRLELMKLHSNSNARVRKIYSFSHYSLSFLLSFLWHLQSCWKIFAVPCLFVVSSFFFPDLLKMKPNARAYQIRHSRLPIINNAFFATL